MSFSKHPATRVHLLVLALCVGACLWIALGGPAGEAEPSPGGGGSALGMGPSHVPQ